jgi:beta-glucosidase
LYVRDAKARVERPVQELKGFEKVMVEAGESARVEFVLDGEDLSFYDAEAGEWVVEPGRFEVRVGSSSRDIRLRGRFKVKSGNFLYDLFN